MDELIEMLDEIIKEQEAEREKNRLKIVLSSIQSHAKNNSRKREIPYVCWKWIDGEPYLFGFSDKSDYSRLNEEEKKMAFEEIKTIIGSWNLLGNTFDNLFENNVKNKKNRLRYITSDEDASTYQYIDDAERKELVQKACNLSLYWMKWTLGLKMEENEGLDAFKDLVDLYGHSCVRSFNLEKTLSEDFISKIAPSDQEKIKNYLKKCVEKEKIDLKIIKRTGNLIDLKSYFYLMKPNVVKYLKLDHKVEIMKKVKEQTKTGEYDLEYLKKAKKELKMLNE